MTVTVSSPTVPDLDDSRALLDQAAHYLTGALASIGPMDFDRPTPCTDWCVRDVLLHLADVIDGLLGLIDTGQLHLAETSRPDVDLIATARGLVGHLLDALASVRGDDGDRGAWATTAAQAGAIEFATHGWDLVIALGTGVEIPEGVAGPLVGLTGTLISDDDRSPRFGPRVAVASSAPAGDRLVAFMGRDPSTA